MLKRFATIALAAAITTAPIALTPTTAAAQHRVEKKTVNVKHTSSYKAKIKATLKPGRIRRQR